MPPIKKTTEAVLLDSMNRLAEEVRDRLDKNDAWREEDEKRRSEEMKLRRKETRQKNIAMLTAGICVIVAIAGVVFGIVSRAQLTNQSDSNEALGDQNAIVICALGQQTADAYRTPLPGEGRRHYLRRMRTQRNILTVVKDLDCGSSFERRRDEALDQLREILGPVDTPNGVAYNAVTGRAGPVTTVVSGGNSPTDPGTAEPDLGGGDDPAVSPPANPSNPSNPNPSPTDPAPTPAPPAPTDPGDSTATGSGGLPETLGTVGTTVGDVVCTTRLKLLGLCP